MREATDTDTVDLPKSLTRPLDAGAERAHDLGGVDDILAFQQARNSRLADRQRSQNEGPVRNRLIARNANAALAGAGAAGRHGRGREVGHGVTSD